MIIKDEYYTSDTLARILVSYVRRKNIKTVADFCVGGGELLVAACERWKDLECYGVDISENAIRLLGEKFPNWYLNVCDFTIEEERTKTFLHQQRFDLILLNPPFTCRGSIINVIIYKGEEYHVSTAMVFLTHSLQYLNDRGCLHAIVPSGVLYSQKDSKLWMAIYKDYQVTIHQENDFAYFKDCSPNIAIISLKKGKTKVLLGQLSHIICQNHYNVELVRGKLSMFEVNHVENGKQLIHTTWLQNHHIIDGGVKTFHSVSLIKGPAIILPRVGNPNIGKICLLEDKNEYVLSDCIFGIKAKKLKDAKALYIDILRDWERFKQLYKGTGAKYMTIERLKHYLRIDDKTL